MRIRILAAGLAVRFLGDRRLCRLRAYFGFPSTASGSFKGPDAFGGLGPDKFLLLRILDLLLADIFKIDEEDLFGLASAGVFALERER